MKTLLVPVDVSGFTASLSAVVADLAKRLKARVQLVHVDVPVPIPMEGTLALASYDQASQINREAAVAALRKAEHSLRKKGIRTASQLVEGDIVTGVLTVAKKAKPAFIVIGSHGHGALYDLFVGSTSTAMLKGSSWPLIIVPEKKRGKK